MILGPDGYRAETADEIAATIRARCAAMREAGVPLVPPDQPRKAPSANRQTKRPSHSRQSAPPKVRTLEPYQPFPVEALPAPLAEYVRQAALALGCDPAFVALPVLAVVASVIGNTRTIRLKRDWPEPAVVWSVIVGDSGTLKTPAYRMAVSYLVTLQKRLLLVFKREMATYQERLQEYQAKKKKAKDEGTDPGEPPEQPVYRRVILSDITIQKLAEILEDNPRGVLVGRDELAGWLGSFKQYKGKSEGSDLPNWLEMFRAGTVIVDRKTGERRHYFVERAAVSITGSIQPGVLARSFTQEFLDAGGGARILMAMPPKRAKRWSEVEVSPEVEEAYHAILDKLLSLNFGADAKGERVPHALRLSANAKAAWIAFVNAWGVEQAAVEGDLASAFAKLEAYAARFALIHHVVGQLARGDDDLAPVETGSVEAGILLCRWFANEAKRIYSSLTESEGERDTRKMLEFIQGKGGRITSKQLMRSNNRKYPTTNEAQAALDGLVECGFCRWEDIPAGPKGGRPYRVCILNTTHDETDGTPIDDSCGNGVLPTNSHDETPPPADETTPKPEECEVASVSSCVMHDPQTAANGVGTKPSVSSCTPEVPSCTPPVDADESTEHWGPWQ